MSDQVTQYRQSVIAAHQSEFTIHAEVATALETAVLKPRNRQTVVHLVLDMLMLQGLKSHATISLLAQHGFMEDSATIARRLLELSVQAVYIGAESEELARTRRAGRYLAFMWRGLKPRIKRRLHPAARAEWSSWAQRFGRFVPRKAKQWGPTFRTMFTEIGSEDLYIEDYSFLSSVAHGAADSQVFQHSVRKVRLNSHEFAPVLLVYGSRYLMALAEQWNREFGLIDASDFARLTARVVAWRSKKDAAKPSLPSN